MRESSKSLEPEKIILDKQEGSRYLQALFGRAMKPQSKRESYWRLAGYEYRKIFQQGAGSAKAARNFTRKQCNRAMRALGKLQCREFA